MDEFIFKYWHHIPIFLVPFLAVSFLCSTFEWTTHPAATGVRLTYLVIVLIIYLWRYLQEVDY